MKIAIFGQYYQNDTHPIIKDIFVFFNTHGVELVIEEQFLNTLYSHDILKKQYQTFNHHSQLDTSFDLLLSIGGDGTILRAATYVRHLQIPILGINAGRLGFLASVPQENITEFLNLVLQKKFTISKRTLLSVSTSIENSDLAQINFALNEITVSRKDTTSMITIETALNGEYLNSYWADGLIIATPTGSTGYSLSCGGPVLTPEVKGLVITPIAPHNLNARPLVIPDETEIQLKISGREKQFLVSLDSRITTLDNETVLNIKKTPFQIHLVDINDVTFLKTLRKKLLWGEDKRN
ncbi:NAD kinase [Flavobacterium branchiophilum]|uniref:NAD kinase n=1 Tax=Flavobacterium branchiophilum TaxID=55197 RepID=A0A543G0J0_9FLAO|nr:NAD kinase [Flavobacterium branchiophilum]OXA67827.1 NAD kinase [Flavobacterium branchiophilum] [Flavobacterium branchiophilum NBRC 15030 = ATCC 35035]TQM39593.1 NAD+ kinase [Flavobacterium branchiophilum]GEM56495.1 NAD kinase [Flavobacterium branchiophilum NBRC 15030 = ATCC 35035]